MVKTEEKKKGVYKNFITGALSAALAKGVTNPVERMEILKQTGNVDYKGLNFFQTIKKIYKTQGILGFYKGYGTLIVWVVPFAGIEFYSVELYRNIIIRNNEKNSSIFYNIICGSLAGVTANTITFPLDVARTRISIYTENSSVKESRITTVLKNLWSKEGLYGIFRGYIPSTTSAIISIGIKQTLFDVLIKKYMIERYKTSLTIFYGSLSAMLGIFIIYPLHMYKRVFQANSSKQKLNFFSFVRDSFQRRGISELYVGLSVTALRLAPYNGLIFLLNEKFKEWLKY